MQRPPDLRFYFDPVCPFAWLTSQWVRRVAAQRDYGVEWRFISLRVLNAERDYDADFPPGYVDGHTAGLHLLRVAHRVREEHGNDAVGHLYAAYGAAIFDADPPAQDEAPPPVRLATPHGLSPVLAAAGLPEELVSALDDAPRDPAIAAETHEALALTGPGVGTPVIHVEPPHGVAFFGPVISRLPDDAQSVELWEHVVGLARFGGFAELKRSLRQPPQLRALGNLEQPVEKALPDSVDTVADISEQQETAVEDGRRSLT